MDADPHRQHPRGPGEESAGVDDPAALKALAHPLRVRLLATLREAGTATASELARTLDTESGSTSYHLRVLARYGFVRDADPTPQSTGHPRERRWQPVQRLTSWSNTQLATTDAGREAQALMRRRQLDVLVGDVEAFERALPHLESAWVEVSGIGDLVPRLTAGSLAELWRHFYAHLAELAARDEDDPAARTVSVVVAGFPREAR
jgi:DNA-binding transcriptional ArsR family regulator